MLLLILSPCLSMKVCFVAIWKVVYKYLFIDIVWNSLYIVCIYGIKFESGRPNDGASRLKL